MLNVQKNKKRTKLKLYLIIGTNSLAILLVDILFPPGIVLISALFGLFVYYLSYSVPIKNTLLMEIRLFIVAAVGISLGSLGFWIACIFVQKVVCIPNNLRAQLLSNFAFPMVFLVLSWLFFRLPVVVKEAKHLRQR